METEPGIVEKTVEVLKLVGIVVLLLFILTLFI